MMVVSKGAGFSRARPYFVTPAIDYKEENGRRVL